MLDTLLQLCPVTRIILPSDYSWTLSKHNLFDVSHDSPYYSPHRGGCVCYSGDFICAKEDYTKAFKKDQVPIGRTCSVFRTITKTKETFTYFLAPKPLKGVYLFLGFSKKDARVVMEGRGEVLFIFLMFRCKLRHRECVNE